MADHGRSCSPRQKHVAFQHKFYLAVPKSENGREKYGLLPKKRPQKKVYSKMCLFLGAAKHCRSLLVSGHDFLLSSHPFIVLLFLLWEGWLFSCVSGAPSFPSFLVNALCHDFPSLIDLQGLFKSSFSFPLLSWRISAFPWYSQLCSLHLLCKEC